MPGPPWHVWAAGIVLVALTTLAYVNSFAGVFVFDDLPAIRDNPSIRDWTAWRQIFTPPSLLTTSGRPVLNASFAFSYALSGNQTWGHHAVNLMVHLLAGLALFGIVRRTLSLARLSARFGADALPLALVVAALWTLHPLQTEAVTYLVQRAESLMGLCYLLTLFCFIRGLDSAAARTWNAGAIAACALGMGTKEVMVSAPLLVLLYDRTLGAGSFGAAWRARKGLYVGLASTWVLLAGLVISEGGNRGGSIGFGVAIGWWQHGLTQFGALTHYLALTFWPSPLVFEYEPEWVAGWQDAAPQALLIVFLVGMTVVGLWRGSVTALVGAWSFAVLAPTSIMPAPTQLMVEHRMYLPLAPLITLVVLGIYARIGRRGLLALAMLPFGCALLTVRRNADYRSEISLWGDTVAKRPRNPTAQGSLGNALRAAGRLDEALAHCTEAVRLAPNNAVLHYELGLVLARLGRPADALAAYADAIRLNPAIAEAHTNYGVALAQAGRRDEALVEFAMTLRLHPDDAGAHYNTGALLLELGRAPEAIGQFSTALRLKPDYPEACIAWGTAHAFLGQVDEALARYRQALTLRPLDLVARNRAGQLLLAVGRVPEAVELFRAAWQINANDPTTRANLTTALARLSPAVPDDALKK